jgi:hypothetical protein
MSVRRLVTIRGFHRFWTCATVGIVITTPLYVTAHPLSWPVNTANQSHQHAITGRDPGDRNRTLILWKETDLIHGKLVRHVVIILDTTLRTAVMLSLPEVVELANALRMAAGNHDTATDTPVGPV